MIRNEQGEKFLLSNVEVNPVSRSKFPAKAGISFANSKWRFNTLRRCSSGVERFLGKEEVTGSNPVIGSSLRILEELKS